MKDYSVTVLEYGIQKGFSNAMVFSGYYGAGQTTTVTYTINVLRSGDDIILVDSGYDDRIEESRILAEGQHIVGYRNPVEVLAKIGIKAEDVKHVILTHAHWDHMGGIGLFPNATFYLQKDELTKWIATMALPKEYDILKASISYTDLEQAVALLRDRRLVLIDGDKDNLFPGIHIRVARDGHSFASSIAIVETKGRKIIMSGDCAYVKANIMGGYGDGVSMPNGYAVGSAFNAVDTMQKILEYADGKIENVLIGHEVGTWDQYETELTDDGLHIAYVVK